PNSPKKFCSPTNPKAKKSASSKWNPPKTKQHGWPTTSNPSTAPPAAGKIWPYLPLIAKPFDDIACARVLSAPAWHLAAEDLVRLAERARKKRGTALYDTLQAPQSELPFDPSSAAFKSLLEFLTE